MQVGECRMKYVVQMTSMIGLALMLSGPAVSGANGLVAHRAVYDLELGRNETKSGYSDAKARLAYEIVGSTCEGWSINYRFAGQFEQTEGTLQTTDTQLTSWEAGDGSELRVNQKQFVGNSLSAENKVIARRPQGAAPQVEITVPEPKTFELANKALFPIVFQSHLIGIAKAGKKHDVSLVYDGTDSEKVYRVVSFIGKSKPLATSEIEQNPKLAQLKTVPAWNFTTSYFSNDQQNDEPLYLSNYSMYENGVAADIVFDYGTYSLKGKLADFEVLKSEPCE
jgi:hypothetical protein